VAEHQIRFDDGAAYERLMGVWSRLAGDVFLDWVAPRPGLRWADIGCGNGAFTELLCARCAPEEVQGIDPSAGQLAFARTRPEVGAARFQQGDAMALPFPDNSFDAAVMALVIFFVPEPAKGVAELARVVGPGGIVAAYAWDMPGGGFPLAPLQIAMRAMGLNPPLPPHPEVSASAALRGLWTDAGLEAVETREIAVTRSFTDFDEFWTISAAGASMVSTLAAMPADDLARLKERMRALAPPDAAGRITVPGRANAVKGRVPG
jgi:SAM-dependent methyltransferase